MKEAYIKSISKMLKDIDDINKLKRIYRLTFYLWKQVFSK